MDLNPYDELGVARDATEADVRKAYRKKAKSTHPDSGGDPAEWSRVCTSLAVLTDPKKRKTFDDTGRIEEDRPDNDRAAALQIIEMHMGTICNDFIQSEFRPDKDPRRMDVIKVIRGNVRDEIAAAKIGIKGGEKVVTFMRDMAKRFTQAKTAAVGEPDPIGHRLELQIRNAEEQIAGIRASVRQRELVLTILDGYQFKADSPTEFVASGLIVKEFQFYGVARPW
jgi:DnaJ domain